MSPTGLRESQRAPLRCTECARRRVRCSKSIPCDSCIKANVAHKCTREVVLVRGTPVIRNDQADFEQEEAELRRENSRLVERVACLEAIVQGRTRARSVPTTPVHHLLPETTRHGDFEEFSTILEEWNIGGIGQRPNQKHPISQAVPEDLASMVRLLPSVPDCRALVRFALESLTWIHCAVDACTFSMEAEQFATSLEQGQFECLRNHSWLAVYLSLLVAGLIFMDDAELFAQLSVTFSSRDDVGKLWYRTVLRQMELSDFIGRPSLHVVQAIAILNLCSRHLGERQRELTLTAIAISTAKSLKMHMLGNELSCPARIRKMAQWSTQPNRELGRRLWWSLVICDWLGAASRSPSIQVDHFDTELSDGAYDVVHLLGPTAIHQPFTSLPPISHHLAMARLASIARTHFEANSRSLKNLKDTLAKVQQLENQSPFVTPLTFEPSTVLPIWAIGQRYHFFFTLNLLRLRLCRVLFQTNVEILDEGYEALRQCALSAAIAISDNTEFPYIYKKTWIFASATIAAGVFLALDTLKHRRTQSSVRTEQQKQRIMSCISTITPYATITTISRGGSIVLGQLLNKLEQAESGIQSVDIMQSILKMGCGSVPSGQTPGQDESAGSVTGFQGQSNPQLPNELLDNELPIIDWNIFEDWSLLSGDVLF